MTAPEPAGSADLPEDFAIDITLSVEGWPEEDALRALCTTALGAAFREAALEAVDGSEVSLVFTDDAAIRELNRDWREKDKPTNVLSFPGSDPDGELYGPLLGDIVFALETVQREADEMEIEFSAHLTHLVVHGILHLFDYDHQDDEEAELMEGLERRILASLGIADPYADRPLEADPE
ncbi:rRNA maturation RNase YbeY [Roseibium aestuarii]|uniref:Endoribonuclease YbeY n=1 Tax=Roseibium aestuarii TaxID=2600299 RepID=A0ABW4K016_9HYPH|nr:rRNA maturation RNase YbeY [Roseibium aestuarii]